MLQQFTAELLQKSRLLYMENQRCGSHWECEENKIGLMWDLFKWYSMISAASVG